MKPLQRAESFRLAVLDVETTGLSRHDRVVEFARVTVVDEYDTLIQPDDPDPARIHGITPEMLQPAPKSDPVVGTWLTSNRPA